MSQVIAVLFMSIPALVGIGLWAGAGRWKLAGVFLVLLSGILLALLLSSLGASVEFTQEVTVK